MNSYKKYFLSKNRIPLIIAFFILAFMGFRNIIYNILVMLVFPYFAISFIKNFDIASYKLEEDEADHRMLIDLLPIDKARYRLLCVANAFMWSMILFLTSYLYLTSEMRVATHLSTTLLMFNFIVCLIPTFAEIIRAYFNKVADGVYIIILIFVGLWLSLGIFFVTGQNQVSELNLFITMSISWMIIGIIGNTIKKIQQNEKIVESYSTNRLVSIYEASTYNLAMKRFEGMDYLTIAVILSYSMDDSYLLASIIIFSAICYFNFKKYFENQSYLQLLPISLKERKRSCFLTSIIQIIVVTIATYLIFLFFNKGSFVNLAESATTIIVALTLNTFLFSCYNYYYHKQKDLFVFVLLLAVFGVTCAIYVFYQAVIPLGLFVAVVFLSSIGLFALDYKRS